MDSSPPPETPRSKRWLNKIQRTPPYETPLAQVLPDSPPQPEPSNRNGDSSDENQKPFQPEHSSENSSRSGENQKPFQPEHSNTNGGSSDENQKPSQPEHPSGNGSSSDENQMPSQPEHSGGNGSTSDENQMPSQPEHSSENGSTSDENQMPSQTHSLTIEEYRISGPIYLPIPVEWDGSVGQRYLDAWEAGLESDVHQILENRHIFLSAVNLEKRTTKHVRAGPRTADYIFVQITQPFRSGQWLLAANEILELCRRKGLDGLNIEIADLRGLAPRISTIISPILPIVCEWDDLLPDIMEALKPNVGWLTIDLVNRRPGTDFGSLGKTSIVPTILITIQEDTKESYTTATDKIRSLLDPRFPDVTVEVIRGTLDYCVSTEYLGPAFDQHEDKPLQDEDLYPVFGHHGDKLWQDEGYMGASIQRVGSRSCGTLGCFIKLRYPNGACSIYGLTNFHVVMPHHEEYKRHNYSTLTWIRKGLRPDYGTPFPINMPSEIDLGHARKSHVQFVKGIEGDVAAGIPAHRQCQVYRALEVQGLNPEDSMSRGDVRLARHLMDELTASRARINAIDWRMKNMRLGVVYAGSGIRRERSGQIMDWALIKVDSARVPAANKLPLKMNGAIMLSWQIDCIGSPAPAQKVYKIGRRSNQTCGVVNPVQSTQLLAWEDRDGTLTYAVGAAWTVMNRQNDELSNRYFSGKGDSGSAVFTQHGEFVGLLYARAEPERQTSYITSAQDLVEDIKHITGAIEVTMLQSDS
jgi:hypothetical protein